MLFPALADEMAESLAAIPLGDMALDSVRNQILSVCVTHSDLDAEAFTTQLRDSVASAPGSARDDLSALEAVLAAGRATLSMRIGNGDNAIEEARNAVMELLQSLESDKVQAHVRQQATMLDDETGGLDRLTQLVAAERQRLTDGQT